MLLMTMKPITVKNTETDDQIDEVQSIKQNDEFEISQHSEPTI